MIEKAILAFIVIGIIVLVVAIHLGVSYLFMLAFNYVARYFGFREISYWVAVCIVFLLSFIGSPKLIQK